VLKPFAMRMIGESIAYLLLEQKEKTRHGRVLTAFLKVRELQTKLSKAETCFFNTYEC